MTKKGHSVVENGNGKCVFVHVHMYCISLTDCTSL